MSCNGFIVRNPVTGDEFCIPIYVEVRHWWRIPEPDPGLDWWRDAVILEQIAALGGQLATNQLRASLTQTLEVARADLQTVVPEGIQLGQQFAQVASVS